MCKNHDQMHYPHECRHAALTLCCGDEADRDLLLQVATQSGLLELLATEIPCMATTRSLRVLNDLAAMHAAMRAEVDALRRRMHERWETEMQEQIDAIPY